ncbi:MAG TPA: MarR family transcriptional regulator [Rhodocyclaceae bacterium]|nr:MarR family transcriptional regulator [Rhodocyclaceae bacterium]
MTQPLPLQAAKVGKSVTKPDWLPTLLSVVRAYQTFDAVSDAHIRQLGLTSPQFDIIATLGNTPGMTCREIGQRTLITKGTLTGVLDRLEAKGLLNRVVSNEDRRSFTVKLTRKGQACFESVFADHLAFMDQFFAQLSTEERRTIETSMARFRAVLRTPPDQGA